MTWKMNGERFDEAPKGYEGFVYLITNTETGKRYIGRKFFYSRRKPPKTKKNADTKRRRVTKESDWRDYWSSSKILQEEVTTNGQDKYTREILVLCKTQGDCNRMETKLLWMWDVLEDDNFYNDSISNHKRAPSNVEEAGI